MALRPWTKRMQAEVEALPDTLAALRESSVNIKQVSEDLAVVGASLRRMTEAMEAMGLSETTDAMIRYGDAMRTSAAGMEEARAQLVGFADALAKLPGFDALTKLRKPR